jgi:uncharacterized membrane protein
MSRDQLSPARMEAFSDGVIAVIITIMVLELRVPGVHEMSTADAVRFDLRMVAVYLLSFVQTGIYWVNHHYLLDDLKSVTHSVLWANLAFLFCLSLIPFGTQWIAVRGLTSLPVAAYALCFVIPSIAWVTLSWAICRQTHVAPANGAVIQTVSAVLNVASVFVALWLPYLSLGMVSFVALLWLLPPRRGAERERAHTPSL